MSTEVCNWTHLASPPPIRSALMTSGTFLDHICLTPSLTSLPGLMTIPSTTGWKEEERAEPVILWFGLAEGSDTADPLSAILARNSSVVAALWQVPL